MSGWHDFLFLRHGQTDWNVEDRFQGQTDIPLNATGVAQAYRAAERLSHEHIDRIISSPLIRALKTAAIVAEHLSLPLIVERELTERHFGPFEGQVVREVKANLGLTPDTPIAGHLPPEAEQWPDTKSRSHRSIDRWMVRYPGDRLLFVSHHGLFAAIAEQLTNERLQGRNAVPYAFRKEDGDWRVESLEPG